MRVRIARRHQKEHAERRIDTDDHHQIVGVPLTPCPAGGPDGAQQIDAEYESEPDDDQRDAEVKQTTGCRHCAPPCVRDVFPTFYQTRTPNNGSFRSQGGPHYAATSSRSGGQGRDQRKEYEPGWQIDDDERTNDCRPFNQNVTGRCPAKSKATVATA